ncbi:MAG: hypothetical protein ACLQBA_07260 [Candidatus Binataceae bacterium]
MIRERRAEQDARIRDDLASADQFRKLIKREGQDGGPQTFQVAQGVLSQFNDTIKLKSALLLGDTGDSDEAFAARDQAILALHEYLGEIAERIEDKLAPIRESRAVFQIEAREVVQGGQRAEAQTFARSLDARGVIDHIENTLHARLKLSDASEIQIAPSHWATDMRCRALLRLHFSGLCELLRQRTDFATVDCVGFGDGE